jgi:putative aldouronate transport system substrate-binding protein
MMMLRKGLRVQMVLAIIFALALAGCSSNENEETPNTSNGSSDAPIEISWLSFDTPLSDNNVVQQYLENRFNVKIKNVRVDRSSWDEQVNIKLATGEVPDLMWMWVGSLSKYVQQGVLMELPEETIREHMPNYSKSVDEVDPLLWEYDLINDKNYMIPVYWEAGSAPILPAYNGDWLKAVGYEEAPKTLAEFEDVLTKFRNNDPDGNGVKDTFGISSSNNFVTAFGAAFGAYSVHWDRFHEEEGKAIFGMTSERARQAFKTLNTWFEAGLIDPEFVTNKAEKQREDFYRGKYGVYDGGNAYSSYFPATGVVSAPFAKQNPDNELVTGPQITGSDGKGTALSYGVRNGHIGIGAQVQQNPAKLAKILEILEALASDEEAYLMTGYGVEGEHFDRVDGVAVMKPEFAAITERVKVGAGAFYGFFGSKSTLMREITLSKEQQQFMDQVQEGTITVQDLKQFSVPADSEAPDLAKLQEEYFIKFITGEVDLEQGFDRFVELWNKSGGQRITEQVNERLSDLK